IHKGQLLARLDTSQYDPQVAAQQAAAEGARQQIGIAQSQSAAAGAQSRQAKEEIAAQANTVAQAQHQAEVAKAAIAEKKSTLKAVQSQVDETVSSLEEARNNYQSSIASEQQAQSDINVAREAQAAAQAKTVAARTMIDAAQAGVNSAQADVDYWKTELPRMKVLLQGDAVSQQAYDSELAKSKQVTAKLVDAKAQVRQAQATLTSAQADARVASAKIQSAQSSAAAAKAQSAASKSRIATAQSVVRKSNALSAAAKADVTQAQSAAKSATSNVDAELSNLRAQRQAAGAAQSNSTAAMKRIGAAVSGAKQAQAQLSSAEINKGYTLIRSQVDGVVTKRLISPGVLVKPGDAILQVAQINPIRLQANVAEEDLARIHLGTLVKISVANDSKSTFTAKVTSIMPSVDAASHTGVVEAMMDNSKDQFLPGQYVKMAINVGQTKNALSVPSNAIQWQADPTESIETTSNKPYVWMAKPVQGQKNAFTAQQVIVHLGASNGDVTAILSGLKPGWKVVMGNQINLAGGMALVDASEPVPAKETPKMDMPGMKM
ncbi:MAG: efflux RND transporter periplasmic adaptor subunit, partial [Abditibacteriaceae bacterium]